jgi:phage head maturation protease
MTIKKLFADITKTEELDDGTVKVWGYASTESVDSDGETVTADAMKAALPGYMKWANVREMHQAKAAGTAIEAEVQDDGRTWFGAHIIDSEAVKKVKSGVYKGFSIGGKVTERDQLNKTVIKGINLVEVSLVDRPANPEAVFTVVKAETLDEPASAIDQLAELLNKGEVTAEKLVEMAKGGYAAPSGAVFGDHCLEEIVPRSIAKGWRLVDDPTQVDVEIAKAEAAGIPVKLLYGSSPIPTALIKDAKTEDLKKCMWSVQDFASVISTLGWICRDAQSESDYEGDASPVPAALRAWLAQGIQIFKDMAAEETAELMAELKGAAGEADVIEMAQRGQDLAKAGAKFSKDAKDKLAKAHQAVKEASDHLASTGYDKGDDDDDEDGKDADKDGDGKKAAGADDLQKMAGDLDVAKADLAKIAAERDELAKALGTAKARVAELEAQPAPGKALLKAVGKGQEVTDPEGEKEPEIIKGFDGAPNEAASLIKMIHMQGGGR